jgi:putative aldouronate transport system permease protein
MFFSLVVLCFFSIAIAILLSEITNKWFKKISQSIVILPNFISWTVIALLSEALFSTDQGLINNLIREMGGNSIPFYQDAGLWPFILTCLRIWHGAGFGSVVYLAAITGMDREIYEAAQIDGASRWQSILHITLPLLRVTAVLLLLMSVGRIFNGDFGMIYNLIGNNTLLYRTTDVIDTYVYRQLMEANNMGMSSAVGLYQSIMGVVMVVSANALARKLDEDSAIF